MFGNTSTLLVRREETRRRGRRGEEKGEKRGQRRKDRGKRRPGDEERGDEK